MGLEFNQNEIRDTFSKEVNFFKLIILQIGELLEDEEIIVKTSALISLFRVITTKQRQIIEESIMTKVMQKNLGTILSKVEEDDDCQLKLAKELG